MGTRCLLALFALMLMLLSPVTSYPLRTNEQSHDNIEGATSFLHMLKHQLYSGAKRPGSSQSINANGHRNTPDVNAMNVEVMPVWPPRQGLDGWNQDMPKDESMISANGSDRDLSPGLAGSTKNEEKGNDEYGYGLLLGKRIPEDRQKSRLEALQRHRDKRPDDYNWGMWFGKRGRSDAYGWGGFFGKRNGDIIDYEDFVA